MRRTFVGLFAVLALTVLGCGGGDDKTPTELGVTLSEWEIDVSSELIDPGEVVLKLSNAGSMPHQLVIVKSDLPPTQLPVLDGEVELDKVNVVQSFEAIEAGTTVTFEINLSTGKYLLLCNLVDRPSSGPVDSHYLNGMVAALLIEEE